MSKQQSGFGCSGCSPAIRRSSFATRCWGSQNCLARWSEILPSVVCTGERRSVGSIGSHTTNTWSEGSELRCKSCSAAEAPRRQVAHVGERRSTNRGPCVDLSKAVSNAAKFAGVSVARGSCPGGEEEFWLRYAATRKSTRTVKPMAKDFRFTSWLQKDDRQ